MGVDARLEVHMLLDGKSAVVIGGGGRIGGAVAKLMAGEGAAVVVNDYGVNPDGSSPREGPASDVVREIEALGGKAVANADSVAEDDGARRIIQTCVDAYGRVDIVVNAAMILVNHLLVDTPVKVWDDLTAVLARGTFLSWQVRRSAHARSAMGPDHQLYVIRWAGKLSRVQWLRHGESRRYLAYVDTCARDGLLQRYGQRHRANRSRAAAAFGHRRL